MKKLYYKNKRKVIIVTFLISAISVNFALFSNLLNQSNSLSKVQEKAFEFDNLKFSGPEINITTPENKTYIAPMSGYYAGTFGFEDEVDGTSRTDIRYVDQTNAIQSNCYVDIQNNYQGHNKVLRVYDGNTDGNAEAVDHFISTQTSGTIEWWWCNAMGGSGGMWYHFHEGILGTIAGSLKMVNGEFRDMAGNNVQYITTNQWYHHKLIFNTASDTYDWYIDGVLQVNDGSFPTPVSNIGSTDIKGAWASTGSCYVDAISYSWDPDYIIGDNLNEGLLLSYDTSFTPDWSGYSLDGQANKTIIGNTTIPMPNDGLHSIQIFGTNLFGATYQSNIRYFSIDTNAPTSMIFFTPYSGMNEVIKSTQFTLTANDGLGSGVSVIRYKINNSGWIDYSSPFNLSSYDYGYYMIYYYSIDIVGHIESENTLLVELIEEPSEPIISGYITMLLITSICIAAIITIKKRLKNSF